MIKFRDLSTLCLFLAFSFSIQAQSPGDTIVVQSWDYSSGNRDTTISFPNNPNLTFERVIMRYAMRCKGARISTGSNRNLGCGEWDYSCNTYVHNPFLADSVNRTTNKYQIIPSTSDSIFSSVPTFEYRPKQQLNTILDSILNETKVTVGQSALPNLSPAVDGQAKHGRAILHYTAAELSTAGLIAGDIDGLRLYASTAGTTLRDFRIGIKHSASNPFTPIDANTSQNFQNVFFHDHYINSGGNRMQFHTPFNWDGTSDLLIELSYRGGNNSLSLWKDSLGSAIAVQDDYSLDLFPSNYVEANSYQGIAGGNQRTVEAWIKTTSGGEVASWGTNATSAKHSFRVVDNTGYIRLEIAGGFIVGSTPVNDGQWHHIAYTFAGSALNNVSLYVDGNLENNSALNNIGMNTQLSLPLQISNGFHGRFFNGQIDQLRIWSAALNAQTIRDWRYRRVDGSHLFNSFLELAYPITSDSSIIRDISGNQRDATFMSTNSFKELDQTELFKEFRPVDRPFCEFYQGNYQLTILNDTLTDTLSRSPFIVEERGIIPRPGSTSSDSISRSVNNYFPAGNQQFDLNGNLVSTSLSNSLDTLAQTSLPYYQRNPSKVEIMSFVTPYGINLDLGQDGKAWYFDVTDFLPVLEGSRRMTMERGGQWQEEMDIQFYFIVGTPPADVKSIKEIWKVDSRPYTAINSNTYFAPRTVSIDSSASRVKIRSAISGHGQQGEFIPRNHSVTVNGNAFSRSVWKECADNPVYPQGGTWIYDRAGWCPGMATDVAEYDITNLITNPLNALIDYSVSNASGTSNYIVSTQLVEYGGANFTDDARIENVLRPNEQTEFGRRNPSCYDPVIILRNTGSNNLTTANIDISINGGTPISYSWNGNLGFMDQTNVTIPVAATFWSNATQPVNSFTARITGVNGGSDQYVHNNHYHSDFSMPDTLPNQFRLVLKTNNAAFENNIIIYDDSANQVFTRGNFFNNTVNNLNVSLPDGCYQLRLTDLNDDGISFFANNAGTGYFRIEDMSSNLITNFNPDFGDRVEYYFTVSQSTDLSENSGLQADQIQIYPNPTENYFLLEAESELLNWTITDAMGKVLLQGVKAEGMERQKIDLSNYAKGIYFIRLQRGSDLLTKKIIKQ